MNPKTISPRAQPELLSLALALLGHKSELSPDEAAVVAGIKPNSDKKLVEEFRAAITAGDDPLGDCFCKLRNAEDRRSQGQTFTPEGIVFTMVRKAQAEAKKDGAFAQIIDCGAGTGRFTLAVGRAFPRASLLAVELDPVCAVLLRANLAVAGLTDRTVVLVSDFREVKLPPSGRRLFIGNPPYLRHHDIGEHWKNWYAATMRTLGVDKASKLAGLHLHFFAKVGEVSKTGDLGIFVTAAEWTDTKYGAALRTSLCGRMGGASVHVVDAKAEPFPGVMTTAAITVFHPHLVPTGVKLQAVARISEFGALEGG